MELESDHNVLETIDELHSTDFRIAKDRAVPVFITQEDNTMFFLAAHLKGYKEDNIKIDINEDGTLLSISGNMMVQEKEEPKMEGFMKVYKIPREVELDEIKADYNHGDSTLTIYMPKQKKGIIGGGIEEVKGEEQVDEALGNSHEEHVHNDRRGYEINEVVPKLKGKVHVEEDMPLMKRDDKDVSSIHESKVEDNNVIESDVGKQEDEIVEEKLEGDCELKGETKVCETKKDECNLDQHELEGSKNDNNKCKIFAPCFFIGSTLIASLVAMFFRLVKTKKH